MKIMRIKIDGIEGNIVKLYMEVLTDRGQRGIKYTEMKQGETIQLSDTLTKMVNDGDLWIDEI